MEYGERQPDNCGPVCFLLILRTQMYGDGGADAHANANRHGGGCVLERESKRNSSECLGSKTRYIDTVDDVVERLDKHGQHHGNRHGNQQGKYRACPHKIIFLFHKYKFLSQE